MSTNDYIFFSRSSTANELSKWAFAFRAAMAEVRTSIPVKVVAVHSNGGVSPVGRVDLQPLVQQTDSAGNVIDLPVVYGVPYLRWQGGVSAVILDPVAGDVGLACFCDRDVSAVVSTAAKAPPGSNRRFSLSDGFYVGASLNAAPTQYVLFDPNNGIKLVSPTAVDIQAPTIKLDGNVEVTGTTQMDGAVTGQSTATFSGEGEFNGVHVSGHHHPGVQSGGSNTGPATG